MTDAGSSSSSPGFSVQLASAANLVALALILAVGSTSGTAQAFDDGRGLSLDGSLLRGIYSQDGAAMATLMHGVNATSRPTIRFAIPAVAVATLLMDSEPRNWDPTLRLGLSQLGATAVVYGLKHAVRRDRPFYTEADIELRGSLDQSQSPHHSFPSGHAGLAFAVGTSLSLSFPEWYVAGPAMAWAALVAYSRPWFGVHYPSDVIVGAIIGGGVAVLVHVLAPSISGAASSGTDEPVARIIPIVIRF